MKSVGECRIVQHTTKDTMFSLIFLILGLPKTFYIPAFGLSETLKTKLRKMRDAV